MHSMQMKISPIPFFPVFYKVKNFKNKQILYILFNTK